MSIYKYIFTLFILLLINSCASKPNPEQLTDINSGGTFPVYAIGSMKASINNPYGRIDLHSLALKKGLYAVGTGEDLVGEIIVLDGKVYYLTANANEKPVVNKKLPDKAAFLLFAYVNQWVKIPIPNDVVTLKELEDFIDQETQRHQKLHNNGIPFLITGDVGFCKVHIAHKDDSSYFTIKNKKVILLGFFAKKYAGYYTYKKNFSHLHALVVGHGNDDVPGGHVDDISLKTDGESYLYLPKI